MVNFALRGFQWRHSLLPFSSLPRVTAHILPFIWRGTPFRVEKEVFSEPRLGLQGEGDSAFLFTVDDDDACFTRRTVCGRV